MLLRSRAGRVFATAALTLIAGLATGPFANAAEKAIWGPTTLPDGSSAFGLYGELGIDTLQLSVRWADVAPSRPGSATDPADPAYRWPPHVADAAAEASRNGIRLALLVTSAPPWANGGRAPIWRPGDPQDFADFLTAVARRYPAVRRWMIWGEPNRADRFQPNKENDRAGPRAYAPLLDAAYAALKRVSPRNRVIGGMTWTSGTVTPSAFLRWMRLPNGKRPRLDWFGHNPFPFRFPKLAEGPLGGFRDISDTDTFSREVRRAYKRAVPLWLSEYTIQTERGSDVFATFVSERSQARYLTTGYKIADELGRRVAGLGWLSLLDEPEAGAGEPVAGENRTAGLNPVSASVVPNGQDGESLLSEVWDAAAQGIGNAVSAEAAAQVVKTFGFPLALMMAVFLFLIVQDRIDRRDPKLRAAPRSFLDTFVSFKEEGEL